MRRGFSLVLGNAQRASSGNAPLEPAWHSHDFQEACTYRAWIDGLTTQHPRNEMVVFKDFCASMIELLDRYALLLPRNFLQTCLLTR